MSFTALSSDSPFPTTPLMLDAACRSVRGELARAARRTGPARREAGEWSRPVATAKVPAGPPADPRAVRSRLLDAARRLRDEDRR